MSTEETKNKKEIVKYLDSLGPDCWHVPFHNIGYTRKGIPDRIVCYRGYFLGIEVKAPGKKASPWQEREIFAIANAGGWAIVATDVAQVRAVIEEIKYRQSCIESWEDRRFD